MKMGDRISQMRIDAGMTQEELAEKPDILIGLLSQKLKAEFANSYTNPGLTLFDRFVVLKIVV